MDSTTHRHARYGDGRILSWFEGDMVMFQSNHGRDMVQMNSLTPVEPPSNEFRFSSTPPELPAIGQPATLQEVRAGLESVLAGSSSGGAQESKPARKKAKASGKLNLNAVEDPAEIFAVFPQFGRVGAKKLHEKKPPQGWVSIASVREFAGELFPTDDSWVAFSKVFNVG